MTVTLFGTDFAAVMSQAFTGQLEPGMLHAATTTADLWGQQVRSEADVEIEGTVTRWTDQQKVARGWAQQTVKIIMLAHGKPAPIVDDEITMRGQRYRVIGVEDGGAEAIWYVAGTLV